MQTKTILAATFAIPLLVLACNREDKSPTAAAPTQQKQAQSSTSPDRMLESAPPAAGAPSSSTDKPSEPSATTPPAATGDAGSQQKMDEPKKGAAY